MLNDPEVLAAGAKIAKRSEEFGAAMTRVSNAIERAEDWLRSLAFSFPFEYRLPNQSVTLAWSRGEGDRFYFAIGRIAEDRTFWRNLASAPIKDKLEFAPHLRGFLLAYCEQQEAYIAAAEAIAPIEDELF